MSNESAAIMFSDVSGSSRLFKEVGDTEARSIISKVVTMMMSKTQQQNGTVIKTIGDEVMASFPSAQAALNAATAIQKDINTKYYGAPLTIRIGFHFGSIIKEAGDVYGEAVNDAADLVKIAKGGQIITSEQTRQALPPASQDKLKRFDEIRLKGGTAKAIIYIAEWEDRQESNATMFMAAINTEITAEIETSSLQIDYEGKKITLTKTNVPFTIGRGDDVDLTVAFNMASRSHCTIDYSRGKFVLIDKSTNGTYVAPDGRSKLYLRREETPLLSTGTISFSPDADVPGPHRIRYSC
jgi:class 3 adenylate cyclase